MQNENRLKGNTSWQGAFMSPVDGVALSLQARSLWAKTGGGEERNLWSPLYVHMADSACVARKLWDEWLSESVKRFITDSVNDDEDAASALVAWLAGVHDIGKAAPGFQYKVLERAELVEEMGLRVPRSHMMNRPPSHANMGEVLLENWLDERGWDYSRMFGSIIGAHHGSPPSEGAILEDIKVRSEDFPIENLGDGEWSSLQEEFLSWLFEATGMIEHEPLFRTLAIPRSTQVLRSALVIMSDWIASNSDFFPLISHVGDQSEFLLRADEAWSSLALPPAWHAQRVELESQEFFHSRFRSLPKNSNLRPAQKEAIEAASGMDGSGLLIIEAPMGNGKTEASLLCSEILASKNGSGGIAYLLPTMATSNAMFGRVEKWLEAVPDSRGRSIQSMQLLHSKAVLSSDYAKLRHWGNTWMGDDAKSGVEEDVVAHQWFGGKKRGLLSSFVVGTVDQLLMAALKTKHVQLRHLGLAGKVVVIDEVHAYDAYMNTYLDRVLTWLGSYGVPTILLSATLPAERRKELIHAYRGRDRTTVGSRSRRKDIPESPRDESGNPAYPLITVATRKDALEDDMYRVCADPSAGTNVTVRGLEDDDDALIAQLSDLLSDGGCACVLRDTVGRAQATYEQLKQTFGDSCVMLVHSRFIAIDRMKNDEKLLRLLGPDSKNRPNRFIVVGTQVIEQSLDIDFDVMITDVAPIDLLLQRMGRLHRHQRGVNQSHRPEKLRQARCYIVGISNWEGSPSEIAKGIECVYPRALLWRSLLALRTKKNEAGEMKVNLPHDIAILVELVYSSNETCTKLVFDESTKGWMEELQAADEELLRNRKIAQGRANAWLLDKPPKTGRAASLVGWLRDSYSLTDDAKARAAVRDTDESIEVVAVRKRCDGLELFPWVASESNNLPSGSFLGDGFDAPDDETARLAANCTVTLPPVLSAPWNYECVINALETQTQVPGWQESRWLRGQLIIAFDSSLNASIETDAYIYRLHYSREAGLELIESRKKGEVA